MVFRAYLPAILLAFLVGAIYAGPEICHLYSAGYKGIVFTGASDTDFYLSAINKSYESPGLIGDPFLYEYQTLRNPFQYFGIEFVLGKFGSLLNLSLPTLVVVMNFVLPGLLLLLIYALAYAVSQDWLGSLFVAAAMLLGNELIHPNGVQNLIHAFLFHGNYQEFLLYSRPINPQASALFFFGTLLATYHIFKNPFSKTAVCISGAGFGLLAYIYPYYWLFIFVILGAVFLYSLILRNFALTLASFAVGVIALIVMIPFVVANIPILLHGSSSALTQTIPSHRLIIEKVILAPLILYFFIWLYGLLGSGRIREWAAQFSLKYRFVVLLLIAGLIVSNQQVLTGKLVFQQHFHFFTNIPLFIFSVSILVMEIVGLLPRLMRYGCIALSMIGIVWFSVGVQVSSYQTNSVESHREQALALVFRFLNEQPTSVVFTNYNLSTRLTMYTQDFTYGGGYDTTFAIPQERLEHDYFVTLRLRGVSSANAKAYLYAHREEVGGMLFIGTYWRDLCGSYGCFPNSVLEELVVKYQSFLKQPFLSALHQHKVEYVIWDRTQDPQWNIELMAQDSLVESGDFTLYSVR